MAGWIKINRQITDHWLWSDAERLKWWIDLLFMANWEDKRVMHDSHLFTLKKGQIIASVTFLMERWGKSKHTIINYLRLLEEENMICREVLHRQTPIITICNYERYQAQDDSQLHSQVHPIVHGIMHPQVHPIVHPNQEIQEIQEFDVNDKAPACTCVSDGEPESESPKFIEELKRSQIWIDQMAMRFHTSADEIKKRLEDFALDTSCRGTNHRNLNDARRHFNDWLRIQLNNEQKTQNNGNYQSDISSRREREAGAANLVARLIAENRPVDE